MPVTLGRYLCGKSNGKMLSQQMSIYDTISSAIALPMCIRPRNLLTLYNYSFTSFKLQFPASSPAPLHPL